MRRVKVVRQFVLPAVILHLSESVICYMAVILLQIE